MWETYGTGKANFNLPEGLPFDLGGVGVLNQKEFYMSGQDVFRIDSSGRVMRHESAWDQAPEAIISYLNPLAHMPILERFVPVFSNAVPKRQASEEENVAPESFAEAAELGEDSSEPPTVGGGPYSSEPPTVGGGPYSSDTGYPKN